MAHRWVDEKAGDPPRGRIGPRQGEGAVLSPGIDAGERLFPAELAPPNRSTGLVHQDPRRPPFTDQSFVVETILENSTRFGWGVGGAFAPIEHAPAAGLDSSMLLKEGLEILPSRRGQFACGEGGGSTVRWHVSPSRRAFLRLPRSPIDEHSVARAPNVEIARNESDPEDSESPRSHGHGGGRYPGSHGGLTGCRRARGAAGRTKTLASFVMDVARPLGWEGGCPAHRR